LSFSLRLEDHLGLKNISSAPIIDDGALRTNSLNLYAGLVMNLN
jgi:hypothetical protein